MQDAVLTAQGLDHIERIDLRHFGAPTEWYFQRYQYYALSPDATFDDRVMSQWGLLFAGPKGYPYGVALLSSDDPELRADGAAIVGVAAREDVQYIQPLLDLLAREDDLEVVDTILGALGRSERVEAVPAVAKVAVHHEDEDTQYAAIEALTWLARQDFLSEENPVAAVKAWLSSQA